MKNSRESSMKQNIQKKTYEIKKTDNGKKKNILCTAPVHFLPNIRQQLAENYNVTYAFRASKNDVGSLLKDIHGWIVDPGADYRVDRELLSHGKELEILVTPSTGKDHIDLDYCEENNIAFDGLRGKEDIIKNIHASAEFSFALLLAMVRHLVPSILAAEQGYWREIEDDFRGIEIGERTIGLIGYGRIGKKMATYCLAFGAKVIIYDPFSELEHVGDILQVDNMDKLLEASDIVGLHVHLDKETYNMFNEEHFAKMKKGSYFLNTSRGGLANEGAMLNALKIGQLAGAAVDVISGEQEGDFYNHKVISYARDNNNLLVSPHIAGLTIDSQGKAAQFSVDTINKFYKE
jgi:phosphoglycerate dehydrogenase-like enzyme